MAEDAPTHLDAGPPRRTTTPTCRDVDEHRQPTTPQAPTRRPIGHPDAPPGPAAPLPVTPSISVLSAASAPHLRRLLPRKRKKRYPCPPLLPHSLFLRPDSQSAPSTAFDRADGEEIPAGLAFRALGSGAMSVFETYERQYCEASASIARKCTAAAALQGEKLKQKSSEIKSGIDGAEELIKKMDREAKNLQPSVRAGLLAKLREYKSDLNNLKSALKRITSGNDQQGLREQLLESGMADTLGVSADQRSRLLRATEKQNQTTDRLRDSHRTMLETEDLGVSILHDLHQQRQSLLHAHDTLNTVDDNVGKSRRIIGSMVRRMDRNKWIIGLIITLLVLAILVILYFKFVH